MTSRGNAFVPHAARARAPLFVLLFLLTGGLSLLAPVAPGLAQTYVPQVRRDFTTGATPQASALGDVDGDGVLDLVVANTGGNSVSVLIGVGAGSFGPKTDFAMGTGPSSVALGDLNGDGRLDIVTSNNVAGTISVLHGTGTGSFGARWDMPTGAGARFVLIEDLNGDERADIAVANITGASVSVLLARTGGGFDPKVDYPAAAQPISVAAGDLTGDGLLDLVVANASANSVSLFPGTGGGAFGPRVDAVTGSSPRQAAIGDVTGDGLFDVAVCNFTSNSISIFPGTGFGLGARTDIVTGTGPVGLAIGDLTGDGLFDLVTTNVTGNTVSVHPGTGGGAFAARTDVAAGTGPRSPVVVDVTRDGAFDLVVTNISANTVSLFETTGLSLLLPRLDTTVVNNPARAAVADVTGDGHSDIVTTGASATGRITILPGDGSGAFQAQYALNPAANLVDTAPADLNDDGLLDLVTTSGSTNTVLVLFGTGSGQFAAGVSYPVAALPEGLVVADVSSDGQPDVLVQHATGDRISVLLGSHTGTLAGPTTLITASGPRALVAADVTGDGRLDLVVPNQGVASVSIFPGNGDGTFGGRTDLAAASGLQSAAVGDLNGDGILDLAVEGTASLVSVFLGQGGGTFAPRTDVAVAAPPGSINLGDLNGDGAADLAFLNGASGFLSILCGDGRGGFGPRIDTAQSAGAVFLTLADVSADGRPDLITTDSSLNRVSVYRARRTSGITLSVAPHPVVAGSSVLLTARVASITPGGATPTGTVRIFDRQRLVASGALVNGVFTTFHYVAVGAPQLLTAVYAGSDPYAGSVSAPAPLRIVSSAAPALLSILDIPADQGGQVRLEFAGSGFDYNGSPSPIDAYFIYRKNDGTLAANELELQSSESSRAELAPLGAALAGWDFITTLPATTDGPYDIVVPTLADSNGDGTHQATFLVRAMTATPGLFHDSAPDSGYSVDNLPPIPPVALAGAWTGVVTTMDWDDNLETDLWYYRVYRGNSAAFVPGPGTLVGTTGSSEFVDAGIPGGFYKVSALDRNGNESGFALLTPQETSGVDGAMPLELALRPVDGASRGGLRVRLALPTTDPARVELLDVRGRRLAVHDLAGYGSGVHELDLASGRSVASGVYLARLVQGAAVRTLRLVHVH